MISTFAEGEKEQNEVEDLEDYLRGWKNKQNKTGEAVKRINGKLHQKRKESTAATNNFQLRFLIHWGVTVNLMESYPLFNKRKFKADQTSSVTFPKPFQFSKFSWNPKYLNNAIISCTCVGINKRMEKILLSTPTFQENSWE